MYCIRDNAESHVRTVTLTFKRSELLYDIRNYAFVEGDIMSPSEENARHQTLDIGEDGNIDRVSRVLGLAHAECVEFLYPFTKTAVEEEESRNDILDAPEEYVITLSVPDTFSKSTCDLLERYIHEYLVCRALADWLTVTKPQAAANWLAKTEDAKDEILGAKSIRMKRVRRGMSPF